MKLIIFLYGTLVLLVGSFVYFALIKRKIVYWIVSSSLISAVLMSMVISRPYIAYRACSVIYAQTGFSCLEAEEREQELNSYPFEK